MGIYKRRYESKKTRKHAFNQESDQENKEKTITVKKKKKENTLEYGKHPLDRESDQKKRKKTFFFS